MVGLGRPVTRFRYAARCASSYSTSEMGGRVEQGRSPGFDTRRSHLATPPFAIARAFEARKMSPNLDVNDTLRAANASPVPWETGALGSARPSFGRGGGNHGEIHRIARIG